MLRETNKAQSRKFQAFLFVAFLVTNLHGQTTDCQCTQPTLNFFQTLANLKGKIKKTDYLLNHCYTLINHPTTSGAEKGMSKCLKSYTNSDGEAMKFYAYSFSLPLSDQALTFLTYDRNVFMTIKNEVVAKGKFLETDSDRDAYIYAKIEYSFSMGLNASNQTFYLIFIFPPSK